MSNETYVFGLTNRKVNAIILNILQAKETDTNQHVTCGFTSDLPTGEAKTTLSLYQDPVMQIGKQELTTLSGKISDQKFVAMNAIRRVRKTRGGRRIRLRPTNPAWQKAWTSATTKEEDAKMKLVSENDIPAITPLTPEQLAAAENDPRFDPVLDPAKDDFDLDKLLRDFEAGKWHGSISVRGHTIEDLEKQIGGEEPPNHGPINMPT